MAQDANHLPFKVGQEAESKSFTVGFRSAWFRCKIKDIRKQKGQIGYTLEFFDFPDEEITWTKLYQRPPKPQGQNKLELMVRPSFPPYFRESERPDSYPASDIVALVDDDWRVGDLVDWWSDGCFWSAKVTKLLKRDKVMVELPEPPIGEGKSYEAFYKDLRPSLNWSPEHGWMVPMSRKHGSSQHCARLVQPLKQVPGIPVASLVVPSPSPVASPVVPSPSPVASQVVPSPSPSRGGTCEPDEETKEDAFVEEDSTGPDSVVGNDIPIHLKLDGFTEEKYRCQASSSDDERRNSLVKPRKASSRVCRYGSLCSQEKVRSRQSKYAASMKHADTVESAIMELEELANKIRWLKGLLRFGFKWSNAMTPSWKILEN